MANSIQAGRKAKRARGKLGEANPYPTNWLYARGVPIARRLLSSVMRIEVHQEANLPKQGPVIVTPNHISSLDPVVMIVTTSYAGRWPRALARANLFDSKLVGWAARLTRQIPVFRGTENAADALVAAEQALSEGDVVLMYPEGTITFDELEWPMAIHSGAARLALATGAPVIPVGQWGANFVLPPRKRRKPRLRGQQTTVIFGPPVDLADLHGRDDDRQAVLDASVRILQAITELTAQARNEQWPGELWDHKLARRVPMRAALRGSAERIDDDGNLIPDSDTEPGVASN